MSNGLDHVTLRCPTGDRIHHTNTTASYDHNTGTRLYLLPIYGSETGQPFWTDEPLCFLCGAVMTELTEGDGGRVRMEKR